jgi:hypothetical protein
MENENKEVVQKKETSPFAELQRKANMLSSSDLVPAQYRGGTPKAIANCIIAMQVADSIGANYLMVMQNLYVIQGKPSWSSQFIISAINSCGRFSPLGFELTGSGLDMSCFAYAIEKETGKKITGPTVTMKMAKEEGWIDKSGSKWKTMPEMMIRYRAASFFGKLYAPEILNGMGTVEETLDIEPPKNVTPDTTGMNTADSVKTKLKAQELHTNENGNSDMPDPEEIDSFVDPLDL